MANSQQPGNAPERKDPTFDQNNPSKQAPGRDQSGRDQSGRNQSNGNQKGGVQPTNPADLGHDPKPDNVQAGSRDRTQGQNKR